mgnify:CR=1 FL=1
MRGNAMLPEASVTSRPATRCSRTADSVGTGTASGTRTLTRRAGGNTLTLGAFAEGDLILGDLSLTEAHAPLLHATREAVVNAADATSSDGEIAITVDLGLGAHDATMWTCDFSAEYVKINAEYRT